MKRPILATKPRLFSLATPLSLRICFEIWIKRIITLSLVLGLFASVKDESSVRKRWLQCSFRVKCTDYVTKLSGNWALQAAIVPDEDYQCIVIIMSVSDVHIIDLFWKWLHCQCIYERYCLRFIWRDLFINSFYLSLQYLFTSCLPSE